jgi:hypothetical protein
MRKAALITAASLVIVAGILLIFFRDKGDAQVPRVTLFWTAPGDNGSMGRATVYTMHYSPKPVGPDTLAWWNAGTPVSDLPAPSPPGATDSVEVSVPAWGTTYRFILTACDHAGNCAGWSNVAMAMAVPPPKVISFKRIFDLRGRRVATRELDASGPGAQSLRLAEAGELRSGMYFLRLRQGGSRATSRIVLLTGP